MLMRIYLLLFSLCIVFAVPVAMAEPVFEPTQDDNEDVAPKGYNVELRGYYWNTNLNATYRSDGGNLSGTNIDVVSDFNLNGTQGFASGEISFRFFERHKIRLIRTAFSHSSATTLNTKIIFSGVTYPIGSGVDATMNVQSTLLTYEYDVVHNEKGSLALRIGADVVSAELAVVTSSVLSSRAKVSAPIPVLGLGGSFNVGDNVSLHGEVVALGVDNSSIYDLAFFIDYIPVDNFGIFAGWRSFTIDINVDTDRGNISWSGSTVGAFVRF